MSQIETWQTNVKATSVRIGDTQVDIADWANLEGANLTVTTKDAATVCAGGLTWDQIEALTAALALHKGSNA